MAVVMAAREAARRVLPLARAARAAIPGMVGPVERPVPPEQMGPVVVVVVVVRQTQMAIPVTAAALACLDKARTAQAVRLRQMAALGLPGLLVLASCTAVRAGFRGRHPQHPTQPVAALYESSGQETFANSLQHEP